MKQKRKVLYTNTKATGKDNHVSNKRRCCGQRGGGSKARLRTKAKLSPDSNVNVDTVSC